MNNKYKNKYNYYNKRKYNRSRYNNRKYNRYKKKKNSKPSKIIVRNPFLFPDRYFGKFRWTDNIRIANGVPSASYIIRGNSLYDPDYIRVVGDKSVTGHAIMSQLYSHYRVHFSKINIQLTFANVAFRLSVTPSNDVTLPVTVNDAIDNAYTKYVNIPSSGRDNTYLNNIMYTKKIYGVDDITQEEYFAATVGNNPVNTWFWMINSEAYDNVGGGGPTNLTCYITITMTYFAEYFGRREIV